MKCKVIGCENKKQALGYCGKHYMQIKRFGKIKSRTKFDPNEIVINGNQCIMYLYDAKGLKIAETMFNIQHLPKIIKYKWCLFNKTKEGSGYVATNVLDKNGKTCWIFLHNLILNKPTQRDIHVDHKDRNGLNNLDVNLRICKEAQNYLNRGLNSKNTSGFKGVSWSKITNKWEAYIFYNYKKIGLGHFDNIEKAREARDKAVKEFHGEFGVTNYDLIKEKGEIAKCVEEQK